MLSVYVVCFPLLLRWTVVLLAILLDCRQTCVSARSHRLSAGTTRRNSGKPTGLWTSCTMKVGWIRRLWLLLKWLNKCSCRCPVLWTWPLSVAIRIEFKIAVLTYKVVVDSRLLVAKLFRSPARRKGMTSRKTWYLQNHWPHFVASSRHICSGSLFLTTCWTSTDCLRWT